MSLLKPDIMKAFLDLLSCRVQWKHEEEENHEDPTSRSSRAAGFIWPIQASFRMLNASSKSFFVTSNTDSSRTTKARSGESGDNIRVATDNMKRTDLTDSRDESHREADSSAREFLPVQSEHFSSLEEGDDANEVDVSVSRACHLEQDTETESYSAEVRAIDKLPV